MDNITDHPVIRWLQSEIQALQRRVELLEGGVKADHEKIEQLETEVHHDHEIIEHLDNTTTSYYTGRRTIAVGL